MGFLARRKTAKFMEELKTSGEMADRHVEGPLSDPTGQELRAAAERRLEEQWQMPPFLGAGRAGLHQRPGRRH